MKYFLLTIILSILPLTGCSRNNAFDDFKLSKKQELTINSLQSSKIRHDNKIGGIFSAVYLNEIYPELFNNQEYFFVFFYTNHDDAIKFTLNKKLPLKIKKLSTDNRFSNLIKMKNGWNNYYLIAFDTQKEKSLNLIFQSGQYFSDQLIYLKE